MVLLKCNNKVRLLRFVLPSITVSTYRDNVTN